MVGQSVRELVAEGREVVSEATCEWWDFVFEAATDWREVLAETTAESRAVLAEDDSAPMSIRLEIGRVGRGKQGAVTVTVVVFPTEGNSGAATLL
jgi:hypothetical protein